MGLIDLQPPFKVDYPMLYMVFWEFVLYYSISMTLFIIDNWRLIMHLYLIICSVLVFACCDNHLSSSSWIIWTPYFTTWTLWEIASLPCLASHHVGIPCFPLLFGMDKGIWPPFPFSTHSVLWRVYKTDDDGGYVHGDKLQYAALPTGATAAGVRVQNAISLHAQGWQMLSWITCH